MVRESESSRQTTDMGIDGQPGKSEDHTAHHVACLSTDSGQSHQVIEVVGNLAVESIHEALSHPDEVLRLALVEAGRPDDLFDSASIGSSQRRRIGIGSEECRRHHVDSDIGALSRQDRRCEEFERIAMRQLTHCIRVETLQPPGNGACSFTTFDFDHEPQR